MMVYGYFGAMTPSYKSLINFEISSIVVFFTPLVAIAIIYKLFIKNDNQNKEYNHVWLFYNEFATALSSKLTKQQLLGPSM